MAYVNPYANTMNYVPSTLWEHPEPYKTDWSTFWGKADEDDEDEKDKDDQKGAETEVEKGAGSQLKSLWGDIVADMQSGYDLQQSQNMFNSVFGPGITAVTPTTTVPNTQQFVGDWQNPNYTGGNTQVYNAQNANAVTTGLPNVNTQGTPLGGTYSPVGTNAYSPSYATQADAYAQYPELEQNWSWAENMPVSAQFDQSGNLIDQGNAVVQTTAAPNLWDSPVGVEIEDGDIDFDAVTDDERDWGDFW
jgi:hypothetical protein